MTNKLVGFIGGGSFGTALSVMLSKKGVSSKIWARNEEVVNNINKARVNTKYLKDIILPEGIVASTNLEEVVRSCDFLVLAVPSHVIRNICKEISPFLKKETIIISIAKGIEEGTGKRLSQVIKEELPFNPVVIISGPSHAEEVALQIPTTVVVSSETMEYSERVRDLFMTSTFRVYTNNDLIGIEIGGAVKNIIALAAGISDGIGFGDNTKAALMTRGMSEIIRIGIKLGGKLETFYGLTGMGDLIVTCTSMHSRNRKAGILIGQGLSMDEACLKVGMVVEGVKACKAFYEFKEKHGVSMPITDMLYKVLFEGRDPRSTVTELMSRDKKDED